MNTNWVMKLVPEAMVGRARERIQRREDPDTQVKTSPGQYQVPKVAIHGWLFMQLDDSKTTFSCKLKDSDCTKNKKMHRVFQYEMQLYLDMSERLISGYPNDTKIYEYLNLIKIVPVFI